MRVQQANFIIKSNHPHEEYIRFLGYAEVMIDTMLKPEPGFEQSKEEMFLKEKLRENIGKEYEEIQSKQFQYTVMDMLYAGEKHLAEKMCSPELIKQYMILLNNPSGKDKEIYINFANYYNMKNQIQKQ